MKTKTPLKSNFLPPLSVSHKAIKDASTLLHSLPDAVFQTDLEFNITGWNEAAEKLHGIPGAAGKNLFKLIKLQISEMFVLIFEIYL